MLNWNQKYIAHHCSNAMEWHCQDPNPSPSSSLYPLLQHYLRIRGCQRAHQDMNKQKEREKGKTTGSTSGHVLLHYELTHSSTAQQDAGRAKQIWGTLTGSNLDCSLDCRHHHLLCFSALCKYWGRKHDRLEGLIRWYRPGFEALCPIKLSK